MLNCRLLGTGVNVPEVGMVAISSRRWSHVDILQMAGRAARVAPGKECGYVLLPTRMDGLGDYSTVYQTLRAFIDQDDELRQLSRAELHTTTSPQVRRQVSWDSHSLVRTGCPRRVAKRPLLWKAPQPRW